MIPLRDINPSKGTPAVNYCIIAACVLAFLFELMLGSGLDNFLFRFGLVPLRYADPDIAAHFTTADQVVPFFSSMFLHGGWLHLIGNMWILFIFGDNIEGELGHSRYLLFYLASGLIAAAIQVLSDFHSQIPTIGASGAIAGVMGAYFVLYPRAKVLTLVPIFFFFTIVEIPAFVFLGFWFVLQFFSGAFSLLAGGGTFSSVAWWAHIGGFVGGMILLILFRATIRSRSVYEIRL